MPILSYSSVRENGGKTPGSRSSWRPKIRAARSCWSRARALMSLISLSQSSSASPLRTWKRRSSPLSVRIWRPTVTRASVQWLGKPEVELCRRRSDRPPRHSSSASELARFAPSAAVKLEVGVALHVGVSAVSESMRSINASLASNLLACLRAAHCSEMHKKRKSGVAEKMSSTSNNSRIYSLSCAWRRSGSKPHVPNRNLGGNLGSVSKKWPKSLCSARNSANVCSTIQFSCCKCTATEYTTVWHNAGLRDLSIIKEASVSMSSLLPACRLRASSTKLLSLRQAVWVDDFLVKIFTSKSCSEFPSSMTLGASTR
mmetsp:Transcript_119115/g.336950  ORF Transcript_119115/g.336950 Transcript_119115/m.336950 type:complete len:315 (+) Transcript_119115:1259-2203(+)